MTSTWRVVTSKKPARQGEAFILCDDVFVLKVYKDATTDARRFAEWIAKNLNDCEARKRARVLADQATPAGERP